MILATFNFNNKEYVYLINDNKIEYGYKDINGINKDLSEEEINLMNQVYSKFMISKDKSQHKKCGIVHHNGKTFQVMYDKISQRKFFYEVVDGAYQKPSFEDFLYLENELNPEVCLIKNAKNDQDNKVSKSNKKILIKILAADFCIITIDLSIIFADIYIKNNPYQFINAIESVSEDTNTSTKTIDDLKEALNSNDNLSIDEKNFILASFNVLEENYDYIDTDLVYNRLANLKIIYDPNPCEDSESVKGVYYLNDNYIILYNVHSLEDVKSNKDCLEYLYHEINHVYQSGYFSLGQKISEALNEIFTLEYNSYYLDNLGPYYLEKRAVYPLIELLGPEVMREYHFKKDPQILINALTEIVPDEDKAIEFIGMFDNLSIEYHDLCNNEQLNTNEAIAKVLSSLYLEMNDYFYVKYGYNMMDETFIANYLYYGTNNLYESPSMKEYLYSNNINGNDLNNVSINTNIYIPYFSQAYIDDQLINNKLCQQFQYYYQIDMDTEKVFYDYIEKPDRTQDLEAKK